MPKVFMVLNPVSGNMSPETRRQKFEQHFARLGWNHEVYLTTGSENLPAIIRQAVENGADLVIASGGDGTISAAATGMLNSNVPLGILPSGTGNMFARDIAIPFDPDRALELITGEHDLLEADLMVACGRALVLNLSVGLSAQTVLLTERDKKKRYGIFAYVGSVFANLLGLRLHTFTLVIDGQTLKFRASELMLTNSSLIGLRYFPLQGITVQPDDGKIDIFFIRARTLLNWLGVLGNVITLHPERNRRFVHLFAQKSIKITSSHTLLVQGDGEMLGQTPVDVEILPKRLQIIIPVRKPGALVERIMARIAPITGRSPEAGGTPADSPR